MKCHKKQKNQTIANNHGMTLVEVLVAMAVLMVAILTFLPLGQSSFQNIFTAGKKIKEGYASVSVIEKLLGNDGANGDYETRTGNIPLQFHAYKADGNKDATVNPLKAGKNNVESQEGIQSIDGAALISTPEQPGKGYSTFICDSVTSSMLAFPTHIADDFIKKHITLYAVGFHFANDTPVKLEYTNEKGERQPVTQDDKYYTFTPDKKDASIAHLVLCGDNDQISFNHSPLYVTYDNYTIRLEIDAPTVIMVGEAASDGNYYYYVTSGEPIDENGMVNEETGEVKIVRKKMDNIGPISKKHITLNSAMNNVVWVDKGEGDNYGGSNEYGSYIMCGDHGQIRRFWKNTVTGNYGWDGDRVIDYDYYNGKEKKTSKFGTTVDYSYASSEGDINLIPEPHDNAKPIFDRLRTHTLFTSNAINKHPDLKFYAAGNLLYAEQVKGAAKGGNCFIMFPRNSGYNKDKLEDNEIQDGTMLQQISASKITSYDEFHGLDTSIINRNDITLTAVVPINFKTKGQGSTHEQYPQDPYMLYCGSIPAIMDVWTTDDLIDYNSNGDRITPWRATLGVAFQDGNKTGAPFYKSIGKIWGNGAAQHNGHMWNYGATTPQNYALSGVCGPENYDEDRCKTLMNSLKNAQDSVFDTYEKTVYPLHMGFHQQYMQTQNETEITVSYLSHPHALADLPIVRCSRDQSPNRTAEACGVFEWGLDKSVTIIDADTINYPDDAGNDRYFSLAVGYYVGGIAYEDWSYGGSTGLSYHNVSVPTVMNNGIVLMRSGFDRDSEDKSYVADQMAQMKKENNVFRPFFTTNDYVVRTQSDGTKTMEVRRNTFDRNVSAGYWRDVYHPLFYSIHGQKYEPIGRNRFNYVMGHILQDKQLNCVCWGETWAGRPEAMWGASDGTLMSWYLDNEDNKNKGNDVDAEFQSYLNLKRANDLHKKYDKECGGDWQFEQKYCTTFLDASAKSKWFALPNNLTGHKGVIAAFRTDDSGWNSGDEGHHSSKEKQNNPMFNNTYLDKCSLQLATKGGTKIEDESILEKRGFISPLQTIEDVEYANDIWIGVGNWGLSNPIKEDGVTYCGKDAVLYNGAGAPHGSWVCVRTWLDQSNGADRGPKSGNCNYIWQAVQVSKQEHCNIQQISYANGMWYAMGYYDANGNGEYDYNSKEYAMMFYARNPQKPCDGTDKDGGWDGGWKLCKTKGSNHTQAYQNDGNGEFIPFEIDGINSVASRND